ncbi:MAG: tyrosine decarboxylase MfnA [Candidatus Hydrothermarchaeaceae archaeon]
MERRGVSEKEVLRDLEERSSLDFRYSDGKILSSMCTVPHSFAKKVFELFMDTNLGDPGLFKGTKRIEEDAIAMLGGLLGNPAAKGYILSGGTEANITALWIARNMRHEENGEVIVSGAGHFSLQKATDLLGLKLVEASVREDSTVDVDDVNEKVGGATIAIVGIAGNTEYGAVDDIRGLGEIASDRDLYLHVDAAFGGFVLPFLEELGYPTKDFDFTVEAVDSITVDPHKMGLAPIPSGGLLVRDPSSLGYIETLSPYLLEKKQHTLMGTRSGASAAATYAVMRLLGKEGYRRNVDHCMRITMSMYDSIGKLGFRVHEPAMNVLVFGHDRQDEIAEGLLERGWLISRTRRGEIRLVVMPHVKKGHARACVRDLEEVLKALGT